MKIKEYAAARGIAYDQSYRAIKFAIEQRGGQMGASRRATEATPEDIVVADAFRAQLGTKRKIQERPIDREEQFKALRKEWLEKWEARYLGAEQDDRWEILGIVGLLGVTKTEAQIESLDRRLLEELIAVAMSLETDILPEGGYGGFTAFLGAVYEKRFKK